MLVRTRIPVASDVMATEGLGTGQPLRSQAGSSGQHCLPSRLLALSGLLPTVIALFIIQWRLVSVRGPVASSSPLPVVPPASLSSRVNVSIGAGGEGTCAGVGGFEGTLEGLHIGTGMPGFRLVAGPRILRGASTVVVWWWASSWHPKDRVVLLSLPSMLYLSYR